MYCFHQARFHQTQEKSKQKEELQQTHVDSDRKGPCWLEVDQDEIVVAVFSAIKLKNISTFFLTIQRFDLRSDHSVSFRPHLITNY